MQQRAAVAADYFSGDVEPGRYRVDEVWNETQYLWQHSVDTAK